MNHPIDEHVGAQMRLRRKMQGLSQSQLASALGITFQQVQKYERGSNRISASKLYEAAEFLQVPVSYFFDGLKKADGTPATGQQAVNAFLMTSEGIEIATLMPQLDASIRRRMLDLARALAPAAA